MRVITGLIAIGLSLGCADLRSAADQRCGIFAERCAAAPDSNLVSAIAAAWVIELDPRFPNFGPLVIGRGGDSAWTVAVYERLKQTRPQFFVLPMDSAHAPHLTGITVEMLGDTARVTTSVSQCTTRQTTFNWTENGLSHKFIPYRGKWALLPGSLAHVADGKC
jgi:hypothetical protein